MEKLDAALAEMRMFREDLDMAVRTYEWPNGTLPIITEAVNGDLHVIDQIEDAPLLTITGHNGVNPQRWLAHFAAKALGKL
jgi:hypothetical protein